jgi:hypothetical protein
MPGEKMRMMSPLPIRRIGTDVWEKDDVEEKG